MAKISDQLKNTAIKVIHSRITDILLNTIYEITNLKSEYSDPDIYGEELTFTDLTDEMSAIYTLFTKLPENLNKELEERAAFTEEIAQYKLGLLEKYKSIFAYRNFSDILSSKSMHYAKLNSCEDMTDEFIIDDNMLVNDVMSAVADSYDIPFIISGILSKLPLRMTKTKYDDLVTHGLELLFHDISTAFIENCKFTFENSLNPQLLPAYGKHFTLIAQSLDALAEVELSSLSEEELDEHNDMITDLDEKIANIEVIMNVCYNIINYIDLLNTYALDEAYACYDNLVIKDLLYSCVDMLKSDTAEMFIDTIIEKSTDLIEELFNESRSFEDTLQDTVQDLSEAQKANMPQDCVMAVNVYSAIVRQYMLEISDELTQIDTMNMERATDAEIKSAIADIKKMIDSACKPLSVAEQKQLKQRFIATIPVDMSPDEFREYMLYALEGIKDEKEHLVSQGNILEFLDDMNLINFDDIDTCDCGHDHHHDHHHDHCNCGHDHHHDHCDCGHDHHH